MVLNEVREMESKGGGNLSIHDRAMALIAFNGSDRNLR